MALNRSPNRFPPHAALQKLTPMKDRFEGDDAACPCSACARIVSEEFLAIVEANYSVMEDRLLFRIAREGACE